MTRSDVTSVELHDSEGRRLNAILYESGMTTHTSWLRGFETRKQILFDIDQKVATMVLLGEQGGIDRIPVRMEPGIANQVKL